MAATVACLHHLDRPVLGFAEAPLRAAGLAIDERDLPRSDPLPALDEVAGIVSFGGVQSVTEIERHPYLEAEAQLLREAVEREVPVLGVCLGGQLLAHALGAPVSRMPARMVGWWAIEPLPPAAEDPLVRELPEQPVALHWNEDCFELPDGGVELAARVGPGVEAFRVGSCAWGIQFHPEVDSPTLDHWYAEDFAHLSGREEAAARAADAEHLAAQAALGRSLFGAFAGAVARAAAARGRAEAAAP